MLPHWPLAAGHFSLPSFPPLQNWGPSRKCHTLSQLLRPNAALSKNVLGPAASHQRPTPSFVAPHPHLRTRLGGGGPPQNITSLREQGPPPV